MAQGFAEYCLKNQYSTNQTRSQAFTMGAASRQAEIDGLNTLNEMSEQKIDDLVLRNIELKKRIDDALDYVFGLYCTGDLDTERFESILKGESNE